jgi:hypothetical protein
MAVLSTYDPIYPQSTGTVRSHMEHLRKGQSAAVVANYIPGQELLVSAVVNRLSTAQADVSVRDQVVDELRTQAATVLFATEGLPLPYVLLR